MGALLLRYFSAALSEEFHQGKQGNTWGHNDYHADQLAVTYRYN